MRRKAGARAAPQKLVARFGGAIRPGLQACFPGQAQFSRLRRWSSFPFRASTKIAVAGSKRGERSFQFSLMDLRAAPSRQTT